MSVTNGYPGTVNDKTIARYDDFLQSIHARGRYADKQYDLYTGDGLQHRHKGLIVHYTKACRLGMITRRESYINSVYGTDQLLVSWKPTC